MHIIGTAGHVDHGKTALITALTGTNPDRLPEERLRGMTLDLGFAHLRFDDGVEAGIVDVPGHERFVHNMLAGAAGMELLLLVVDAREGVRAQTLEHLAILQFLNVGRTIVAASKIDLLEGGERDEAYADIARQLRGTIAEDAPMMGVSAVTGENVETLRDRLHGELTALPRRNASAPVYLPIDRVFALRGHGTIVTGTLMQGSITNGDDLKIEPGATAAHVRSIEVFGSQRERVEAGTRVALSLPGLDRRGLGRGHAIVGAEFSARQRLNVHFVPLGGAAPLLRRKTPVRAYIGSAEVLGTLTFDEAPAGEPQLHAQLHLREPVVAFAGLRFVLRRPSPMTLLGGGFVERSDRAASGDAGSDETVAVLLRGCGLVPADLHAISVAANLREDVVRDALERLCASGAAIAVARPPAYVDGATARELFVRVSEQLAESHRAEPWAMGLTSLALARAHNVDEPTLIRVLDRCIAEGGITARAGYYALTGHRPTLTVEQGAFFERITSGADDTLTPAALTTVTSAVKASRIAGLRKAFDMLLATGELVKVGDDLYRRSQIHDIRARTQEYLKQHQRMTAAQFRDLLGTTRKYAVPLLEWLDARGVTVRSGDYRMLRRIATS
ncbi:MAG: selenocysteine-specific translation elongation factor [Candidatus Eremiobacteraeota bacterium]|nr:selenocysteine-specific translation elongation factor [Candidatus Eremiobacteraeota bacterium]MBV9055353.1 selenocysteine-specific translation elongation factor [Candidatus Eremiobacteraeota bacterium]MBV9701033.1 selenocysteine-specific translation elongation factor [Candidatus Eremiobacteraeota bacterium]